MLHCLVLGIFHPTYLSFSPGNLSLSILPQHKICINSYLFQVSILYVSNNLLLVFCTILLSFCSFCVMHLRSLIDLNLAWFCHTLSAILVLCGLTSRSPHLDRMGLVFWVRWCLLLAVGVFYFALDLSFRLELSLELSPVISSYGLVLS